MNIAQKAWLYDHPQYRPAGPPRDVKFEEWGNLYDDGAYERMDNQHGAAINLARKPIAVAIYAPATYDPKTFEEAPAPQEGGEVAPGVVGRLMEYTAIIEAASAMARRMGLRFVPDSDKITAFVSQNSAVTPTPNSDGGKAL